MRVILSGWHGTAVEPRTLSSVVVSCYTYRIWIAQSFQQQHNREESVFLCQSKTCRESVSWNFRVVSLAHLWVAERERTTTRLRPNNLWKYHRNCWEQEKKDDFLYSSSCFRSRHDFVRRRKSNLVHLRFVLMATKMLLTSSSSESVSFVLYFTWFVVVILSPVCADWVCAKLKSSDCMLALSQLRPRIPD